SVVATAERRFQDFRQHGIALGGDQRVLQVNTRLVSGADRQARTKLRRLAQLVGDFDNQLDDLLTEFWMPVAEPWIVAKHYLGSMPAIEVGGLIAKARFLDGIRVERCFHRRAEPDVVGGQFRHGNLRFGVVFWLSASKTLVDLVDTGSVV